MTNHNNSLGLPNFAPLLRSDIGVQSMHYTKPGCKKPKQGYLNKKIHGKLP